MNIDDSTITYKGDDICIEEMPQGCVISDYTGMNSLTIASTHDSLAVIASLRKMLAIQMGEDEE